MAGNIVERVDDLVPIKTALISVSQSGPLNSLLKSLEQNKWLPREDSNLGQRGYTLTPIARRVGLYLCRNHCWS